jgi:hypothetical protein
MARMRFWIYAVVTVATVGSGLAACTPWPTSQPAIDYEQCRWGVGCQARCAQGYEGLIPYCGRD